jgi:hypothetical protein
MFLKTGANTSVRTIDVLHFTNTLIAANTSFPGVVKVGNNITSSNGFINISVASPSISGVVKVGAGLAIDGEGILSSTLSFTANASNWNGTAPTSLSNAIDRLAIVVKRLNGGTGA